MSAIEADYARLPQIEITHTHDAAACGEETVWSELHKENVGNLSCPLLMRVSPSVHGVRFVASSCELREHQVRSKCKILNSFVKSGE